MENTIMNIKPLLSKFVPIAVALKGISKINPKARKFIEDASVYGYGGDQILEFLRNQLGHPDAERERLESGAPNLRPDEKASLEQMNQREAPGRAIQHTLAAGAGIGAGLAGLEGEEEQMPMNEEPVVPQGIPSSEGEKPIARGMQPNIPAVKQAGEKLKTMNVAQKVFPQQQRAQPGVMEGISPQLKEFVEGRIAKGKALPQIASLAKSHFFDEIKDIEDESGMPFAKFLESLYGKERENARVKGLAQQGRGPEINTFLEGLRQLRQQAGR